MSSIREASWEEGGLGGTLRWYARANARSNMSRAEKPVKLLTVDGADADVASAQLRPSPFFPLWFHFLMAVSSTLGLCGPLISETVLCSPAGSLGGSS